MSEAVVNQARLVRAAIERAAIDYGKDGAATYMEGLIIGVISHLIRTRGRRHAYEIMTRYVDEILTPELPQ